MTDRGAFGLAVGVVAAAVVGWAVPWWVIGVVALGAATLRRPMLVAALLVMAASTLAARADTGMAEGPRGRVDATVTLTSDPIPGRYGVSAVARLDGHLVVLRANGSSGGALRQRLAGERLAVTGRAVALSRVTGWHRSRHISATVDVDAVGSWWQAEPVWRFANAFRGALARGAERLDPDQRALFLGLVIGDDRDQSVLQRHAFRSSGLAHLLAVSGQNVAFVLLVAAPALTRLLLRARFAATVFLLGWFTVLTRFEPSVLRAVAMAGVAALAFSSGRRASSLRVLSLAVVGVVLGDPLIVWSFGFGLSVGATLGLVLLAGPLGRGLPGPAALRLPLGVTLAATAGTAPLLLSAFGTVPAASPVANLAAVPAAGAVMVWGMTAGAVAGWIPAIRVPLHLPTRALLWWIDGAARLGSDPALPRLNAVGVLASAVALLALVGWRRRRSDRLLPMARAGAAVVAVLATFALVVAGVEAPAPGWSSPSAGAWLHNGDAATVLVVGPGADAEDVLDGLDSLGAGRLEAIVALDQRAGVAGVVSVVRALHPTARVVAPPGDRIESVTALEPGWSLDGRTVAKCDGRLALLASGCPP